MASCTNEESAKNETRATRNARILKETEDLRKQVNEALNRASTKSESRKQVLSAELTLSASEKKMLKAELDTLRAKLDQSESDNKTLRSEIDGLKDSMQLERDGLLKEKLEMEDKVKSLEMIVIEKSKMVNAAATKEEEEDGSSSRPVVKHQLNELIKKLEKELRNLDDVAGVSNNNNNNNKKKKMELDNYVFMINELLVNLDHLNKSVSGNVVELERVTKVGEHLMTRVLSSIHVENTVTNIKNDITVVVEKRGFWDTYNSYDDEMKQHFKVYVGFLMFISIFGVVFTCAMLLEAKGRE